MFFIFKYFRRLHHPVCVRGRRIPEATKCSSPHTEVVGLLVVVAVVGPFDSFSVFANSDVMFALVQLLSNDINKKEESPHPLPLHCRLSASGSESSEEGGSSETRPDTGLSRGS